MNPQPIESAVRVIRDRGRRWKAPASRIKDLCAKLRKSPTIARLAASESIDEQMRFHLCLLALLDVLLDEVGSALHAIGEVIPADAPEAKSTLRAAAEFLKRAEAARAAGRMELAEESECMARELKCSIGGRLAGRPQGIKGDLVIALERVLLTDEDLSQRDRRRLTAAIVTEFVEELRPDRIAGIIRDRYRNFHRLLEHPHAAILQSSESALEKAGLKEPKSLEEHDAAGPLSGIAYVTQAPKRR